MQWCRDGLVETTHSGRGGSLINGAVLDRLNQARVIVSPARHIDPFRDRPDAQEAIWREPQQLDTGLSG